MEQIIAVHRNVNGDIISFQTSEGRIISYQKAFIEVENGMIDGVSIVDGDDGSFLIPTDENSFDQFPIIY